MTVATVVERDGKFLLVEEAIDGQPVLNQPAGHWDPGETLLEAARRETLEETAWEVEIEALLGVYEYQPPHLDYGFLRFAYVARPVRHHPERPLDAGILRALWLSPAELRQELPRHRSPMVLRCMEDFGRAPRHPLELVAHLS